MATTVAENIWIAASDGLLDQVKDFIAKGQSPNEQDDYGYSPMHAAVSYGHVDLLKYLISVGGNVNLRDVDNDTPLHVCEDPTTAQVLLDAGADIDAENDEGLVPYVQAFLEQRLELLAWYATVYQSKGKTLPEIDPALLEEQEGEEGELEEEEEEAEGEGEEVEAEVPAASGGAGAA